MQMTLQSALEIIELQKAQIDQLCNVEAPTSQHIYWPKLDIDIAVDSIEHPSRYPLKSKRKA